MSYNGFVVKVKELRPHSNADRLQIATFFGNDTCVDLSVKLNDIGIYFPSDLQLSEEYCITNHLLRELPDGTKDTGYMDARKRNITAIRLRGERSDGIYMPLSSLEFTGVDINSFKEGDLISVVNGIEICRKYIPIRKNQKNNSQNNIKNKKIKTILAPLFKEHADTEQLAYNLDKFKTGDQIEITLKMHGTSQRTGYLPVIKKFKKSIIDLIYNRPGKPIYEYDYVTGTRRTVLENFEGGFYGSNAFRKQHEDKFRGKLWKGETVYYEVVSFTDDHTPIMGSCQVPKDLKSIYGDIMVFHYGLATGSDIYVYRMTMTNEDGDVVEYTPDFMRYRCEQIGVKTVPVFIREQIPGQAILNELSFEGHDFDPTPGGYVKWLAEQYYDGRDPIGITHIREGVVIRIINRPKFEAYKHKNFTFKLITGIIKEQTDNCDKDILSEM